MSAADLLIWGLVLHLVADWPLQNDWMADNKADLRHPAGYVHAGIHGLLMWTVFPWYAALALAVSHLLIDTRKPVVWWSRLIGQKQPKGQVVEAGYEPDNGQAQTVPLYDIGLEVRFWTDQVFHIACVALAALAVASA